MSKVRLFIYFVIAVFVLALLSWGLGLTIKNRNLSRVFKSTYASYHFNLDDTKKLTEKEILEIDDYGRILIQFKSTETLNDVEKEMYHYSIIQKVKNEKEFFIIPIITEVQYKKMDYFYRSEQEITSEVLAMFKRKNNWNQEYHEEDENLFWNKLFYANDSDMGKMSHINSFAYDLFEEQFSYEEVDDVVLMHYLEGDNVLLGVKAKDSRYQNQYNYYLLTLYYIEDNKEHYSTSQMKITKIELNQDYTTQYTNHIIESGLFE